MSAIRTETNVSQRSKNAAIYRKAAKLVETKVREMSCCAVLHAKFGDPRWSRENHYTDEHCALYSDMFSEQEGRHITGSQFWNAANGSDKATQHLRVLALSFMAAMVEAGDA